jgi:hypothetical protein
MVRWLVHARQAYADRITACLDGPGTVAGSVTELAAAVARERPTVAFVDVELAHHAVALLSDVPKVAICEDGLDNIIRALGQHAWLSHVITPELLASRHARMRLASSAAHVHQPRELLAQIDVGRVALIASSSRRESRLERLRDFFASRGIPRRTVEGMRDIAEELITNALYDAPLEAGHFPSAVPRTTDVELPPELAVEISYGLDGPRPFVRIRDPFGALTRTRMLTVLDRCNHRGVTLDESRGGAGLGLWRVFSLCSAIAISVVSGRLTDMIVWVEAERKPRANRVQAVHLDFPHDPVFDGAAGRFAAEHDYDLMDDSFTAVIS